MPTAAYLGTTSLLLPLEWVQSVKVDSEGRLAIQEARDRSWAFSPRGRRHARRSWDVSLTAGANAVSNLEALAVGAYGDGPFRWVTESAYISNAMTPTQSLLPGAAGGPVQVPGGHAPRSILGPDSTILAAGVSVLPGHPAVVSAHVSGAGATVQAVFRDAAGLPSAVVDASTVGALMQRVDISVPVVPSNARTVDIVVQGHVTATRPQVTWTRTPQPWVPGEGATGVVITGMSKSSKHIDGSRGLLYDVSLNLKEID